MAGMVKTEEERRTLKTHFTAPERMMDDDGARWADGPVAGRPGGETRSPRQTLRHTSRWLGLTSPVCCPS